MLDFVARLAKIFQSCSNHSIEETHQMTHPKFDKVFAENLGATLGGCVRDQIVGFFNADAAKAAKVTWIPIPFVGSAAKRRFKAQWAAALQGVSVWAALDTLPEYLADQRLSRRTMFQTRDYVDYTLNKPVFSRLSEEDKQMYSDLRIKMEALGQTQGMTKRDFSIGFLKAIAEDRIKEFDEEQIQFMSQQIGMAFGLFCKVIKISVDSPLTYEKAEKKIVRI